MSERLTYLTYLLAWATPVISLQWAVGWRTLRRIRGWIGVWLAATIYLAVADGIAIGAGIWQINPALTTGAAMFGLPVEEALFFGLTSLMVVQALVLVASPVERERIRRSIAWLHRDGASAVSGYRDGLSGAAIGALASAAVGVLFGFPSLVDLAANAVIAVTPLPVATFLVTQPWLSPEVQRASAALGGLALVLLGGGVLGVLSRLVGGWPGVGFLTAVMLAIGVLFGTNGVGLMVGFLPSIGLLSFDTWKAGRFAGRPPQVKVVAGGGLTRAPDYGSDPPPRFSASDRATSELGVRRRELAGRLGIAGGALLVGATPWLQTWQGTRDPPAIALGSLSPLIAARAAQTGWDPRLTLDRFGLVELSPLVTANGDFYRMSKNAADPRPSVADWRLELGGLADRSLVLRLSDVLALDYAGRYVTLECVDNPAGGPLASTAHWIGVPLAHLLALIRPGSEAARVVVVGEDGLDEAIPLSRLGELDPLLAYGMNGAPLPLAHGFPLRFVVPGYYGFKNVKWVRQIRLDRAGPGYWARRGWDDLPPIRSTARIEVARRSDGGILLAGVAFAGARGVQRVDVRVDGGSWRAAELRQPALDRASWQQWRLTVAPGARLVEARVIDGTGAVPPAERTGSFPSGAGGWSQREVTT